MEFNKIKIADSQLQSEALTALFITQLRSVGDLLVRTIQIYGQRGQSHFQGSTKTKMSQYYQKIRKKLAELINVFRITLN